MEIVIALLMYLGNPPELKEHLLCLISKHECLKKRELQQEILMLTINV